MVNKDDFEILEDYINKTMSYDDVIIVESRLKDDENFERTYQFLLEIRTGFKVKKRKDLISELSKYEKDLIQIDIKKKAIRRYIIFALLSLIVISGFIYFCFFSVHDSQKTEIKTENTNPIVNYQFDSIIIEKEVPSKIDKKDNNSITDEILKLVEFPSRPQFADNTLRSDIGDTTYLTKAIKLFEDRQYKDCLKSIGGNNQSMDRYLLAHCYYNLKQFDKASKLFSILSADSYFIYQEDAEWYLAQSYLNQYPEKFKVAKSVLLEIKSNTAHPNNKDAIFLIKNITSIND